jgi:hypothetical protein
MRLFSFYPQTSDVGKKHGLFPTTIRLAGGIREVSSSHPGQRLEQYYFGSTQVSMMARMIRIRKVPGSNSGQRSAAPTVFVVFLKSLRPGYTYKQRKGVEGTSKASGTKSAGVF